VFDAVQRAAVADEHIAVVSGAGISVQSLEGGMSDVVTVKASRWWPRARVIGIGRWSRQSLDNGANAETVAVNVPR